MSCSFVIVSEHCFIPASMWHSPVGPGSRKFLGGGEKSDSILQCEGKRKLPQGFSAALWLINAELDWDGNTWEKRGEQEGCGTPSTLGTSKWYKLWKMSYFWLISQVTKPREIRSWSDILTILPNLLRNPAALLLPRIKMVPNKGILVPGPFCTMPAMLATLI